MTDADRGRMIAQAMTSELEKIAKAGLARKMIQLGGEMVTKGGVKAGRDEAGKRVLQRTGKGLGSFASFHGGRALRAAGRTAAKHPVATGVGALGAAGATGGVVLS